MTARVAGEFGRIDILVNNARNQYPQAPHALDIASGTA